MVDIKEANEDVKIIAARNNIAVFVFDDLFNKDVNNHFHYDYKKFIAEVSRVKRRDMTNELIDNGYLLPLPYGEYEINLKYRSIGMGRSDKNLSVISSLADDIRILYHETAHVLQDEYRLFSQDDLKQKYGEDIYKDPEINKFKHFLREQHAECFSYMAMMLRSEKPLEFAKMAVKAWQNGVFRSYSAFVSVSKDYTGNNVSAYYATFPVMIKTIKECFKIYKSGKNKDFFTKDGRLDDKKIALKCQDIVFRSAYSFQRFKSFFADRLKNKANKIDFIYKKGKMKFLKTLVFFIPNEQNYLIARRKQKSLVEENKRRIEEKMEMSYEEFLQSRYKLNIMKEMEHPITQTYLDNSLFETEDVEEIKLLIKEGANVNAKDIYGQTALMKAQTTEKTKLLLEAGADVNAKDIYGQTALMKAQSAEKTKLLLEAGADVNAKDNFGVTALMLANSLEQAKILVADGAVFPENDDFFLNKNEVKELKIFAQKLQQCKLQKVQQSKDRVKDLLQAKSESKSEKQFSQPLVSNSKQQCYDSLKFKDTSYNR